jgi:hypothetical protein
VAEVVARRLGSPLDSMLKVTDGAGKLLAISDDFEDRCAGLITHQADSYVRFKVPADGTYYVHLGDAQEKGGSDYAFRLRVSAPRPDFELRVTPSNLNVRGGASVPLTVHAIRRDGFAGEIVLSLKDAPAGFALAGGKIPAGQDVVKLTLKAPAGMSDEPVALHVEGTAKMKDQVVTRAALPAEEMQQAFSYRHLVPAENLLVDVLARQVQRNEIKLLSETPVKLTPGVDCRFLVGLPLNMPAGKLSLELTDPPEGVALRSVTPTRGGTEMLLTCDAAKAKAGAKGNLIVTIMLERQPPAGAAGARPGRMIPVGTLPAIPFEVMTRP